MEPRPDTVRVTRESLNSIKVGPWDPREVITQGSEAKPSPSTEETQHSRTTEPVPRSVRITQERLEKFGFTKGCPKCEALRRGDEHTLVHPSRVCRKRFEVDMPKYYMLSKKLSEVEEINQHYIAGRIESSDQGRIGERAADEHIEHTAGVSVDGAPTADCVDDHGNQVNDHPDEVICTWIECANAKISLADVTE